MIRGKYIVVEGQDGTGKSTQVERLRKRLKSNGIESIEFHEPGEGDKSLQTMPNKIRKILLDKNINRVPSTNILLFSAARNELWNRKNGALESLNKGIWVIASRNWKSTIAYQGYGEGYDIPAIESTTKILLGKDYFKPDFECIVYIDELTRIARMTSRDDTHKQDTFESKASDFQKRVNDSYFKIAKKYKTPLINGSGSVQEVEDLILSQIMKRFKINLL